MIQVSDILRYLFPVPKDDSHRVITFANQDDYISFRWVPGLSPVVVMTCVSLVWLIYSYFQPILLPWLLLRHHVYKKADHCNIELTEVGPRFELKCKFGVFSYTWGSQRSGGFCADDNVCLSVSFCSIHDSPGDTGSRGYSRCRMALAPVYKHFTEETVPEC